MRKLNKYGKAINNLLIARNQRLDGLAKSCGNSTTAVLSNLMRSESQSPTMRTIEQIAKHFNMKSSEFVEQVEKYSDNT